jgi:hypothetical protein
MRTATKWYFQEVCQEDHSQVICYYIEVIYK